ncbi:MAG: NAD-glutamate dehydrogenase [Gammaproteobacteria bacterium RIFCSPHIGHO2_12_FULL_41_15]|nr:MAG: NAD-glutamate dehydrogenase [Gammaproteobacteria bacterium RIFCSPHIGHO2_12_FULL_41_15]
MQCKAKKVSNNNKLNQSILSHIHQLANTQYKDSDLAIFQKFIKLFFSNISADDMKSRTVVDLYGAVTSQWQLLKSRELDDPICLNVFTPKQEIDGWQSPHTIIEVIADDMPFLIDTIAMQLNRLNLYSHLMIHTGGIRVIRNAAGQVTDILSYGPKVKGGTFESPIYIEIDRQTNPNALQLLKYNLLSVLGDVKAAVEDWPAMQAKVRDTLLEIDQANMLIPQDELDETKDFLEWLLKDHFTFLGYREYTMIKRDKGLTLRLVKGASLGVLRDDSNSQVHRSLSELPPEARALALDKGQILIVSKTNTRSTVHRPTYTDYIGVKRFNSQGEIIGERRFLGLFTSSVYNSNPKYIPFLRKKVEAIAQKSGFPMRSHSGKDLLHVLSSLPRDDLFHATVDELYDIAMQIMQLQERRRIRLIVRKDSFARFMSCLVYMPRENFSTELLNQMHDILLAAFHGIEVNFSTSFSQSILAVTHYVVRIDPKKPIEYDVHAIEKKLEEVAQSWQDSFRHEIIEYFGEEKATQLLVKYRRAFSVNYRESFSARSAVFDVELLEKITEETPLEMSFYRAHHEPGMLCFKLYNDSGTIPLSDAIPMLENMGLRVIGEQPYTVVLQSENRCFWINNFTMQYSKNPEMNVAAISDKFQRAFFRIWRGHAENDGFNKLVLAADLDWREISILRAYAKYFRQIGVTFSQSYIEDALIANPTIVRHLVELFLLRFDPELVEHSKDRYEVIEKEISAALEKVMSLDQDKILRLYASLIKATLRTNYFQTDQQGKRKHYLSFKIASREVPDLPEPIPHFETFVYSPHFEAVHLRMAKVARGGIRWSDRQEDFRTEVLGLMKAQQVKNALIVPAGAKGGFITKSIPVQANRDEVMQAGIACYQDFIRALLDVGDNIVDGKVITPQHTVRYDEDDTYIVVAADKGTATFSDIANGISAEYNFWLRDAFASGGSAGYDHKKMAITARGAWVSVECQFQELGINLNRNAISVIGIGDMSGDVFGNGMLLSNNLKVVAAFNHQHIFIDPQPDCETSYQERKRLFYLHRSTWADYDEKFISTGGGVFSRQAKSIRLSKEMQTLFDTDLEAMPPNDLLRMILKLPVDLLWNGGIGTYVKASTESNDQVGDRANDAIRINGNELRVRVVGEGGNLGLTQLGRIEFALAGGHINTDFIDNSGGVDCSDHEVNIKILLNTMIDEGKMTLSKRNAILEQMTDEVAELVLENNYKNNKAISLAKMRAIKYLSTFERYLHQLEKEGKLNRALEFLPTKQELQRRRNENLGLVRPELAVLMAYSKNLLKDELLQTEIFEDEYLSECVKFAFPSLLQSKYHAQISQHPLRHDIIATFLSNFIVSDMGMLFCYQMHDETGAPLSAIVRAYAVSKSIFRMDATFKEIAALDNVVSVEVQQQMIEAVTRLVRRSCRWFLRNHRVKIAVQQTIDEFAKPVESVYKQFSRLLIGNDKKRVVAKLESLLAHNVPIELAKKIAHSSPMYHALNIVQSSLEQGISIQTVAKVYFILEDRLDLLWFRSLITEYPVDSRWTVLAKASAKVDLDWIQRSLTTSVMAFHPDARTIGKRIEAWFLTHENLISRWQEVARNLRGIETKEFAILSVAIKELMDLAQTSAQWRLPADIVEEV